MVNESAGSKGLTAQKRAEYPAERVADTMPTTRSAHTCEKVVESHGGAKKQLIQPGYTHGLLAKRRKLLVLSARGCSEALGEGASTSVRY